MVARNLIDIFETNPEAWNAVRFLNMFIPWDRHQDFYTYLHGWYSRTPNRWQTYVAEIAGRYRILPSQQTGIGRHRGDTIIGHRASDSLRARLYSGIRAMECGTFRKATVGGTVERDSGVATVECNSHTNGGSSGSSFRMSSNAESSFRISNGGKSFKRSSSTGGLRRRGRTAGRCITSLTGSKGGHTARWDVRQS